MEKIKEFLKTRWKYLSVILILLCLIFYLGWDLGKSNALNQDLKTAEKKSLQEIKKIEKENREINVQYKKEITVSSFWKAKAAYYELAYKRQAQITKDLENETNNQVSSIDTIPANKQSELFTRLSEEYLRQ